MSLGVRLMELRYGQIPTPVGPVHYVVSSKGALAITTPGQSLDEVKAVLKRRGYYFEDCQPDKTDLHHVGSELKEYLSGTRVEFTFPLDLEGTEFQLQVWGALQEMPYGKTCGYGDIARRINNPKAARAVGQANHRTPLPLVIPCHRVCGHDGGLTGFAGGLTCKQYLLDLEQRATR